MKNWRPHWAIYGSGLSMESEVIRNLLNGKADEPFNELRNRKGVLFSNFTLNQFIKEEAIHDDYSLSVNGHKSIRNYSSGEQKKLLLTYLLKKRPEFIILDGVFDMLDVSSKKHLLETLNHISKEISILQLFKRRNDLLPFIDNIVRFQEGRMMFSGTLAQYDDEFPVETGSIKETRIPKPLKELDMDSDPLIQFNNISVNYGGRAILDDINWEINKGDFWQLIGPNGSGKTTLLTMLTGDNPKAYGQNLILFGNKKGSGESVWEIKKKIGYITPAMTVLFKGRHTVENMVISGLYDSIGLYNLPTFEEKKLAGKWIELIGLQSEKFTYFSKLTEENQCMVLIARSMIKHPPLLILDEPTHGLDDHRVKVLTGLINQFAKESSTAIIYVSHKAEKGLSPDHVYELKPFKKGSKGMIIEA